MSEQADTPRQSEEAKRCGAGETDRTPPGWTHLPHVGSRPDPTPEQERCDGSGWVRVPGCSCPPEQIGCQIPCPGCLACEQERPERSGHSSFVAPPEDRERATEFVREKGWAVSPGPEGERWLLWRGREGDTWRKIEPEWMERDDYPGGETIEVIPAHRERELLEALGRTTDLIVQHRKRKWEDTRIFSGDRVERAKRDWEDDQPLYTVIGHNIGLIARLAGSDPSPQEGA